MRPTPTTTRPIATIHLSRNVPLSTGLSRRTIATTPYERAATLMIIPHRPRFQSPAGRQPRSR